MNEPSNAPTHFERRPFTLDRTVRLIIAVVLVGVGIILIHSLSHVLLPFVIACVLAYIIHPLVDKNKSLLHLRNNAVAAILSLIEIVFVISAIGYFLIPYLISEVSDMVNMCIRYNQKYTSTAVIADTIHHYIATYLDFDTLREMFSQQQITSFIERSLSEVWSLMGTSLQVLFTVLGWVVILLYLVFLLIDYDAIKSSFKGMLPPKYATGILKVARDIKQTMNRYFRGQSLVSFIVGVLFSIGFLIIGLPLAVVFGLGVGILNMVPYLQLISIPIAALLCLVYSVDTGTGFWLIFAETIAVYCIVQVIQDMILTPRIMGKYMGLKPAIIFLSLSIWGTLLGFIGLIIALPLTTLIISYYKEYIIDRSPYAPQSAPQAEETDSKNFRED